VHLADRVRPRRRGERRLGLYLLIAPALILIGVVFLYPFGRLLFISFHSGPNRTDGPATVSNYTFVLQDEIFRQAVEHNLLLIISVPIVTILAFAIALLLHEAIRGWRIYRTVVFMPYMIAIPVLGSTFIYLLSLNGVLNTALRDIGLGGLAQDWLGNPDWALPSIAALVIYHELGFGVILFLARMLSLPEEVFQAARIDGCRWFRMHLRVTLPQMRSVIGAFVTLELITMLSWIFAYVYSTTRGGPNFATYILELFIYENAFTFRAPSIAAAVAVLLLAVTSVLVVLRFRRRVAEVNLE
jgi:ABC-type sugar transport system permease subunit